MFAEALSKNLTKPIEMNHNEIREKLDGHGYGLDKLREKIENRNANRECDDFKIIILGFCRGTQYFSECNYYYGRGNYIKCNGYKGDACI